MSARQRYAGQRRGDRGAYERYLRGMDASMRQKVALTAAHLLAEGTVADMGMGSGTGSEALAALYPALRVVGVDVEPTMVELARERYSLDNLSFEVGDIARPVFPSGSLDGILNSSVLHHVTSFNGYSADRAADALREQVKQLADRGILIVRDFVAPEPATVLLDLPADDGSDGDADGDAQTVSTATLFERFAKTYRPLSERPGFSYEVVDTSDSEDERPPPGWRRYRVQAEHAVEFVLRKDYRRDWDSELKEAYTYFTQNQFERQYARLGLRVLASTPIWNPWIVRNRFESKFAWRDDDNAPLEFPPTNYIIVGEKVPVGEGVSFAAGDHKPPLGFLELEHYRDRRSGQVMDLASRANRTLDIIPWFELDGDLFILARASYPRPIIRAHADGTQSLDSRHCAGYVVEPLVVVQTDKPLGTTVEATLAANAGIASDAIAGFRRGSSYYPSPGGIQEEVRASFVEIEPTFSARPLENRSAFTTSGRVLTIEAQQLLRASQVGGLPDARLELNAYDLLLHRNRPCGPWIGETIELADIGTLPSRQSVQQARERPPRRAFERASADASTGFLEVRCRDFLEHDARGNVRSAVPLEFVRPRPLSLNTIATALLAQHAGRVWIGLDDDDLPAAQAFTGNSELFVAPAWRLPGELATVTPAVQWVRQRLADEYGLQTGRHWHLGGPYHPSLGLTPEIVHPIAVEATAVANGQRSLTWLPLRDAVDARDHFQDGHLRIVLLRAAHALGLLS